MTDKIEVENINTPGKTTRVDAAKYTAMRKAMLKTMPRTAPGDTAQNVKEAAKPHLPGKSSRPCQPDAQESAVCRSGRCQVR